MGFFYWPNFGPGSFFSLQSLIFIGASRLVHPYGNKLNFIRVWDFFYSFLKIQKGNENFNCKKYEEYSNQILLPVPGPENG